MSKTGIRFRFQHPLSDFTLDVDSEIPATGVTALFGRSGSGKTTLLRCIAGLEKAESALLSIGNTIWQDSNQQTFLPPYAREIGYVFQENALFPHLKVIDNLTYGMRRAGSQKTHQLDDVISLLNLESLLKRTPDQLSGGEKQRVAIGRALLNAPKLLLMDEPMAALDKGHKKEILPYLEKLHSEAQIPIIYVSHDLNELVHIADRLILIDNGHLLANGPMEEILSQTDLPISRDEDAGAVIDAQIIAHDTEFHLSHLKFAGGELLVGWIDKPVGSDIRIRIHAKDVSLALEPPGTTSILNILPATVVEMATHGRGREIVKLDINGTPLLARITRLSQTRLGLTPGMQVYAQIKSVALSL